MPRLLRLPPPRVPTKLVVIAAVITMLLSGLLILFDSISPQRKITYDALPEGRATLAVVLLEIERADRNFKIKLYSDALDQYRDAAKRLDDLVKFETKSPKPNYDALQHYYNIQVILGTKTRITEIGLEASTL